MLLLLMMHLMLLSLSVSHAGVIEVMHGRVDVAYMASSLHGHGLGLLVMHRWPRAPKHHLSLNVSQCLHAWDSGRGEGGPGLALLLELRRLLGHVLGLLGDLGHELSGLGRELGQGHDGGVLVLHRAADTSAVRETVRELVQS